MHHVLLQLQRPREEESLAHGTTVGCRRHNSSRLAVHLRRLSCDAHLATLDREAEQEPLTMNRWKRWLPGLQSLSEYQAAWFPRDLMAGLVLTAMLVPVG